ncbi:MAG TPA: outer membrane protein assembly factor BamB [Burkholderiaceae bacterium]|nr:outer membrane protein assembly factor BamB [Burkholderiaceae bacterium]
MIMISSRSTFAAVLGAGMLALAGCGSLNPFADEPKFKPAQLAGVASTMALNPAWQLGADDNPAGALTIVGTSGGPRVFAAQGRKVRVIDPATGNVVQTLTADSVLTTGAASDGSLVTAATREGDVIVWELASGKQLWKSSLNAEIISTPAVADGIVATLTTDGRLVGFDAADGRRRWVVQRAAPSLTLRVPSPVIGVRGGFLVGLPAGRVMALGSRDGQVRWESTFAPPKGSNEVERISDIMPAVGGLSGEFCVASYQGKVGCINVRDGRTSWQRDFSSNVGLAAGNGAIFATDDKSHVSAFSAAGVSLWKNEALSYRQLTAPAVMPGAVAVGDFEGYVHLLSTDKGELIGRTQAGGRALSGAPLALEVGGQRVLVVQDRSGALYAFQVK